MASPYLCYHCGLGFSNLEDCINHTTENYPERPLSYKYFTINPQTGKMGYLSKHSTVVPCEIFQAGRFICVNDNDLVITEQHSNNTPAVKKKSRILTPVSNQKTARRKLTLGKTFMASLYTVHNHIGLYLCNPDSVCVLRTLFALASDSICGKWAKSCGRSFHMMTSTAPVYPECGFEDDDRENTRETEKEALVPFDGENIHVSDHFFDSQDRCRTKPARKSAMISSPNKPAKRECGVRAMFHANRESKILAHLRAGHKDIPKTVELDNLDSK